MPLLSPVAGRDFRLRLVAHAETLRIEVTDTRGDDLPRLRPPAVVAESGRVELDLPRP
ncbi:hypothetical protein [Streptomyces sp. P9(2023)]|uniref:hypothetical protein n=1 Tax=Streptomyces sp. P9(2023) TaxID=3064394 RepID=UPI0037DD1F09